MDRRLKDVKNSINFTKISTPSRRKDCCVITPSTKYPTIGKILELFWFSYILWYSYVVLIFPDLLVKRGANCITKRQSSKLSWLAIKKDFKWCIFASAVKIWFYKYLVFLGMVYFFNIPVKNSARSFLSYLFLKPFGYTTVLPQYGEVITQLW